jgi:hypothetical protein
MRPKPVLTCAASLCLLATNQVVVAATPNDRCAVPPGLSEEISRKYPGASPTHLAELSEYDRKLFRKDHGTQCPGLVRVDFYGEGKPTWAFVLIARVNSKRRAELVVAHQVGNRWEATSLDTAEDAVPVVWRQGPGDYRDFYGEKTIRATHPVIVFAEYEGWAILYAWTNKEVKKIWIND